MNTSPNKNFDTRPLSERTYEFIVDQITSGALVFGDAINAESIAKELGISTMPVREAIKRLAFESIVEIKPRSKVLLKEPSRDSVLELIEAREFVEIFAVEKYLRDSQPVGTHQLKDITVKMKKIIESGDMQAHLNEFLSLDRRFHKKLSELSRNRFLINFYKIINLQVSMTFIYSISEYQLDPQRASEHLDIMHYLEARSHKAINAVKDHLQYFKQLTINKMRINKS